MKTLKLGYLPLCKGSWVNDRLGKELKDSLAALKSLGHEVVDCGKLIISDTDADEACALFEK
ncbi:MAG TPA: hypothetical protein PKY10_11960, partial [Lentisphaeria bacterium]|nr:hypothetical protein [Lentisphaeria bacterium]